MTFLTDLTLRSDISGWFNKCVEESGHRMRVGEFVVDCRGPGQTDNMQFHFQLSGLN